jgi:predicted nucleic acid-binding protein
MIATTDAVFADTSFYVALASPADENHRSALALSQGTHAERRRMVTTAAVLVEIGNTLARQRLRPFAVTILESIQRDEQVEVIPLSDGLYVDALRLFADRRDKEWGLTDCISFVVMEERGIREALTADRHFRQAGFRPLLETG